MTVCYRNSNSKYFLHQPHALSVSVYQISSNPRILYTHSLFLVWLITTPITFQGYLHQPVIFGLTTYHTYSSSRVFYLNPGFFCLTIRYTYCISRVFCRNSPSTPLPPLFFFCMHVFHKHNISRVFTSTCYFWFDCLPYTALQWISLLISCFWYDCLPQL